MGDGPIDWCALVPRLVHPTKVQVIEAMRWIQEPLSASELRRVFDGAEGNAALSYHLKTLAALGVLKQVAGYPVNDGRKRLYVLTTSKG